MTYTKSQITKAGKTLRKGVNDLKVYDEAMDVLTFWRSQHAPLLEIAYREMEDAAQSVEPMPIVARREKRARSIIFKLRRESTMSLAKMQDIGGCRAIFRTEKDVKKAASKLRKKKHIFPAKNYLKHPKVDGYRGIHLVGEYKHVELGELFIEFQLRTKIQHAWATAGEITELFTSKQIKHLYGDEQWKDFYKRLSDFFDVIEKHFVTRAFDFDNVDIKTITQHLSRYLNKDLHRSLKKLKSQSQQLQVSKKFEAYANSLRIADEALGERLQSEGYVVIYAYELNTLNPSVKVTVFEDKDVVDAQQYTSDYERQIGESQSELVVLLSTQTIGGIRDAYPNYFADSMFFTELLHAVISTK